MVSNDAVNDNLTIFTCVPFSSVKPGAKIYPTELLFSAEESGLPRDSILMFQQIRTVSVDKLRNKVSEIKDIKIKGQINNALVMYFDLNEDF